MLLCLDKGIKFITEIKPLKIHSGGVLCNEGEFRLLESLPETDVNSTVAFQTVNNHGLLCLMMNHARSCRW